MNTLKQTVLFALSCFLVGSVARGDIEFTLTPASSVVQQGNSITFRVWIESNSGDVNLRGIDVLLLAGAGDGTGGVFASPTSSFFSAPPSPFIDWDLSEAGKAYYTRNVGLEAPDFKTLFASTKTLLGSVVLDTRGVSEGLYSMAFDTASMFVMDNANAAVGFTAINANYQVTLTAVPEPTTFFGGAVLFAAAVRYRTRRRSAT